MNKLREAIAVRALTHIRSMVFDIREGESIATCSDMTLIRDLTHIAQDCITGTPPSALLLNEPPFRAIFADQIEKIRRQPGYHYFYPEDDSA
jgi:hypothetical protein